MFFSLTFLLYTPARLWLALGRPHSNWRHQEEGDSPLTIGCHRSVYDKITFTWLVAFSHVTSCFWEGGIFKTSISVVNIYWPVWVFTHRAVPRDYGASGSLPPAPLHLLGLLNFHLQLPSRFNPWHQRHLNHQCLCKTALFNLGKWKCDIGTVRYAESNSDIEFNLNYLCLVLGLSKWSCVSPLFYPF